MGTVVGAVLVGAVGALAWLGWRRGGAVAVLVVLALHALAQDHHVDDAGIVYAYAESLAGGHGLVPQPGAAVVEGVSDPLWLALLVPGAFIGADVGAWSSVLQAGLVLFVIFAVGRIALRAGASPEGVAVARLVTATSGVVFAWTSAGLEGALLAALLAGVAWAASAGLGPVVLIGVMLCAWTRPEGAAAGLGVALAGLWLREGRRDAVWPIVGALAGLASLHGLRWLVLDSLMPTSALAKLGTPSWRYLVNGLVYAGLAAALAGLPAFMVGWPRTHAPRRWLVPVGLVLLTGLGLAVASGGDWMRHGRFLAPYLPLAFALGVPPLVAGFKAHPLCRFGLVLGIVVGWGVLVDATLRPTVPVDHGLRRGELYAAVGHDVCDQLSVATPDIGGVLWGWPQVRVLDLAGLIDADAAHNRLQEGYWPGRLAQDRPVLVDLHDSWAERTGLQDPVLDELGYRILARRDLPGPGAPTLWVREDCGGVLSPGARSLLDRWREVGSGADWHLDNG